MIPQQHPHFTCPKHHQPFLYLCRQDTSVPLQYCCTTCLTSGTYSIFHTLSDLSAILLGSLQRHSQCSYDTLFHNMHTMFHLNIDQIVEKSMVNYINTSIRKEEVEEKIHSLEFVAEFEQHVQDIDNITKLNIKAKKEWDRVWETILPSLGHAEFWIKQALGQMSEMKREDNIVVDINNQRPGINPKFNEILLLMGQHEASTLRELQELKEENQALRKDKRNLESRMKSLEKENSHQRELLQSGLKARIRSLANSLCRLDEHKKENAETKQMVAVLSKKMEGAESIKAELQSEIEKRETLVGNQRNEIGILRGKLDTQEREVRKLKQLVEQGKEKMEDMAHIIEFSSNQLIKSKSQQKLEKDSAEANINRLKKSVDEMESAIGALGAEKVKTKEARDQEETRLKRLLEAESDKTLQTEEKLNKYVDMVKSLRNQNQNFQSLLLKASKQREAIQTLHSDKALTNGFYPFSKKEQSPKQSQPPKQHQFQKKCSTIPDQHFEESTVLQDKKEVSNLMQFLREEDVEFDSNEKINTHQVFQTGDVLVLLRTSEDQIIGLYSRIPLADLTDDFEDTFIIELNANVRFGVESVLVEVRGSHSTLETGFRDLEGKGHRICIKYDHSSPDKLLIDRKEDNSQWSIPIQCKNLEVFQLMKQ